VTQAPQNGWDLVVTIWANGVEFDRGTIAKSALAQQPGVHLPSTEIAAECAVATLGTSLLQGLINSAAAVTHGCNPTAAGFGATRGSSPTAAMRCSSTRCSMFN
jgi:hypothetical protein